MIPQNLPLTEVLGHLSVRSNLARVQLNLPPFDHIGQSARFEYKFPTDDLKEAADAVAAGKASPGTVMPADFLNHPSLSDEHNRLHRELVTIVTEKLGMTMGVDITWPTLALVAFIMQMTDFKTRAPIGILLDLAEREIHAEISRRAVADVMGSLCGGNTRSERSAVIREVNREYDVVLSAEEAQRAGLAYSPVEIATDDVSASIESADNNALIRSFFGISLMSSGKRPSIKIYLRHDGAVYEGTEGTSVDLGGVMTVYLTTVRSVPISIYSLSTIIAGADLGNREFMSGLVLNAISYKYDGTEMYTDEDLAKWLENINPLRAKAYPGISIVSAA